MISKIISHAACLRELASNPKSFFNCPDLHGGVVSLPGGRFRSGEIRFLDRAGKVEETISVIAADRMLRARLPDAAVGAGTAS